MQGMYSVVAFVSILLFVPPKIIEIIPITLLIYQPIDEIINEFYLDQLVTIDAETAVVVVPAVVVVVVV